MVIKVPKGKYVLAVSGGVDSMALLDLLSKQRGIELVVAHFNHGIREDSNLDESLVKDRAQGLGLLFEAGSGSLGPSASEDTARKARYGFLQEIKLKHQAEAVITAHHLDDRLETALLNVVRGTGRRGLSSLTSRPGIVRPLLSTSKAEIVSYALKNQIQWRDDPTNQNTDYLRNLIRQQILPKLTYEQKDTLISKLDKVAKTNKLIDSEIAIMSRNIFEDGKIDRQKFTGLPNSLSTELMYYWLRQTGSDELDRPAVNRLNLAVKTARPGTTQPSKRDSYMEFSADFALLKTLRNKAPIGLV